MFIKGHVRYSTVLVIFGTLCFIMGHILSNSSIVHNRSCSVQYCLLSVMFGKVLFIIDHLRYSIVYYRSSSVQYTVLLFMFATFKFIFGTIKFIFDFMRYSISFFLNHIRYCTLNDILYLTFSLCLISAHLYFISFFSAIFDITVIFVVAFGYIRYRCNQL